MEIQRQEKGADPHRARYHSSVMDVENLHSGQEFKELPDTYTIFIIEKDFYGKGEPVYPIERINLATGKSFEDGEHILYVNGEYRGETNLGKLMHDFNCTQASDMNFELMADRTRYLKENPKGVSGDVPHHGGYMERILERGNTGRKKDDSNPNVGGWEIFT